MPSSRYFVVVSVLFVTGVVVECVTHCGEGKCPPPVPEANLECCFTQLCSFDFCTFFSCKQPGVCGCPWVCHIPGAEMGGMFPPGGATIPARALGLLTCAFCGTTRSETSHCPDKNECIELSPLQLISNVYIFLKLRLWNLYKLI